MSAVRGTLDTLQLPEILQLLAEQRKTGILTVQGQGDILAISFLEGAIVGADALSEPVEEGLGEILIADGLLERRDLSRYVSRQRAGEGQLLDLLLADQRLSRRQVVDALRRHTLELLVGVLAWREGDFKFYGGDEVAYEEGFRPLRVDEVLLAGVPEDGGPASPAPTADGRYRRTGPERTVRRMTDLGQRVDEPDEPGTVWLTPQEAELYERVSPERTIGEIGSELGIDADRAAFLGFDLERRGLIAAADAAPPDAAAAPLEPPPPAPAPAAPLPTTVSREALAAETEAREAEAMPAPAARAARAGMPRAAGALLALGLLAAVVAGAVAEPTALLLPFPWLDDAREAYDTSRERVRQLAVGQAARTAYLLEGRFPDRLEELVERGLLAPEDAARYRYAPSELAYALQRIDRRGVALGTRAGDTVSGDFLLDPEFFAPAPRDEEPPLVLLD